MVSPWYQAVMTDTKALATSATIHIFSSCELSLPTRVFFSSNLCYFIYLIDKIIMSVKLIVQIKNYIELN